MARTRDETAYLELEAIRKKHHGVLKAEDVVAAAWSESSPLHSHFEWDDTRAAQEYRVWQARQLIRYVVIMVPRYKKPIIAYVSLKGDRHNDGGGYRSIVDVLSDVEQRKMLLAEALQDLQVWQDKYQELTELVPIFDSIRRVAARQAKAALASPKPTKVPRRRLQPVTA